MRVYPAHEDLGLNPEADRTEDLRPGISDAVGVAALAASEQTTQQETEKGKSMSTITPPTDEPRAFEGDRYERLRKSCALLAADENLGAGEPLYNAEGLIAFADSVAQLRLLDGLSEYDANTVSLLVALDFIQGPRRMAWRIWDMHLDNPQTPQRDHDNEIAVIYAIVGILHMVLGAWLGPDPQLALARLAADAADVYDMLKEEPGNAGDYLLAARDSITDAIGALG